MSPPDFLTASRCKLKSSMNTKGIWNWPENTLPCCELETDLDQTVKPNVCPVRQLKKHFQLASPTSLWPLGLFVLVHRKHPASAAGWQLSPPPARLLWGEPNVKENAHTLKLGLKWPGRNISHVHLGNMLKDGVWKGEGPKWIYRLVDKHVVTFKTGRYNFLHHLRSHLFVTLFAFISTKPRP